MTRTLRSLGLALLGLSVPAWAFTDHRGIVAHDEVWTRASSPHVLRTTVEVAAGATLRIEAGAVVAAEEMAQLIVTGTLRIDGTPDARVLMTGLHQNQWGGIAFTQHSRASITGATFATSSPALMRVVSADRVELADDSLQFSPLADNAVGLYVSDGHVVVTGGVVVSPLAELYDIALVPTPPVAPVASPPSVLDPPIAIERTLTAVPQGCRLDQNYPNPFNPKTTIRYAMPDARHVVLSVFDVSGAEVRRLVDAEQQAGTYAVEFAATDLPSGIYFYRLQAGSFLEQKRMLLVK